MNKRPEQLYQDAARLLAQMTQPRGMYRYNDPRLWVVLGVLILVAGACFTSPRMPESTTRQPSATLVPATRPTVTPTPTIMVTAMETLPPAPTSIPLTWKPVWVGQEFPRDTVTAFTIDPRDPEVLYASMKRAGIYKSMDGGLSWQPSHHGLSNAQVTSMLIDSQNPDVLYAGTRGGIFKSEDGGANWTRIGEGNYLLMDSHNSHLYARDMDNIYESTDQGNSWKSVYSSKNGCPGKVYSWAIHPTDGETLFIGAGMDCEAGIYTSTDGGHTWAPVRMLDRTQNYLIEDAGLSVGLDGQGNYYFHWGPDLFHSVSGIWRTLLSGHREVPFGATFDSAGVIYFECNSFLCKFNPDEKQRLRLGKPEVAVFTIITISPQDPNTIYVAGEGIAVSKDGGQTWSKRSNGLGGMLLTLETGEGNPPTLYVQQMEEWDDRWWLYNISKVKEPGQPLYISNDGAQTWELVTDIGYYLVKDTKEQTLYRIGRGNTSGDGYLVNWIWRSQDGGRSWTKVFIPEMGPILTAQGGLLYLYMGFGLWDEAVPPYHWEYVSEDYGREWRTLKPPRDPKLCYGSTLQFIDAYRPMAIDPSDGNHVFVIDNGTLLESHDSCDTTSVFATAPNTSMNSIAFDPNSATTIYAGTDSGAYVSFDGGAAWNEINDGLLGTTVVYSVVVDKDSNVYAATPHGIFKLESSE
jgi:photosystem II stability/assembly factor-like uncharacterized protein